MAPPIRSAAIIGAGIVGVTTAYALSKRGVAVTLVDRLAGPARGTSYANGGQLSYLYTDALAHPKLIAQLPGLAVGRNPSFRMRISLDPDFLRWTLAFLRNCTDSRFHTNTVAAMRLALESQQQMIALQERHSLSFGYAVHGKMHLYPTSDGFAAARRVLAMKSTGPDDQQALTFQEARSIEPALDDAFPRPAGIIHSPGEAVGDAHQFCVELTALLRSAYGVTTRFNTSIEEVSTRTGRAVLSTGQDMIEADIAVVCSGPEANPLLRPLGVRLPVWPMKGYSFTAPPGTAAPTVSITDTARRIVFTRLNGLMRIAGLADLGWRSAGIDQDRLRTLMDMAQSSLPHAAVYKDAFHPWAGLRPMTPDSNPRIGRVGAALAYNIGHGMLGWTLALGSAERLAQLLIPDERPHGPGA